jgi:glycerophosphoryl diester phosphodiesterase
VNGVARKVAAIAPALLFSATGLTMDVQGHRGARGLLPENTLPSFKRALELGVDTLEMDCGITRDGVVVVHHDRRLNPDVARGPDGRWVAAPAPTIYQLDYQQLQQFDVGRIRPGSEYARRFPHQQPIDGTRIPRLSAVFELAKDTRVRFNIETKLLPGEPNETLAPEPFARAVIAEVKKAGLERRVTIQSFDFRTLKVVEREAPEIETVYLTEVSDADPSKLRAAGAKIWSPDFRAISPYVLGEARKQGLRIVVWTPNEPADIAAMIAAGVDGIISDYPDRVLEALKRSK